MALASHEALWERSDQRHRSMMLMKCLELEEMRGRATSGSGAFGAPCGCGCVVTSSMSSSLSSLELACNDATLGGRSSKLQVRACDAALSACQACKGLAQCWKGVVCTKGWESVARESNPLLQKAPAGAARQLASLHRARGGSIGMMPSTPMPQSIICTIEQRARRSQLGCSHWAG